MKNSIAPMPALIVKPLYKRPRRRSITAGSHPCTTSAWRYSNNRTGAAAKNFN